MNKYIIFNIILISCFGTYSLYTTNYPIFFYITSIYYKQNPKFYMIILLCIFNKIYQSYISFIFLYINLLNFYLYKIIYKLKLYLIIWDLSFNIYFSAFVLYHLYFNYFVFLYFNFYNIYEKAKIALKLTYTHSPKQIPLL